MKQAKIEERAKAAKTKIIHMKVEIYSLQETLYEEQSKVYDLKQYKETPCLSTQKKLSINFSVCFKLS